MSTTPTPQAPQHEHTPVHQEVSPKDSFILGIGFAWELGYTIAVPAVVFGLGGGWLDKNVFDTSPLFLLLGLGFAFVISFLIISDKLRMIAKRMPKDLPKKKKEPPVDAEHAREQELLHDLFRPPSE